MPCAAHRRVAFDSPVDKGSEGDLDVTGITPSVEFSPLGSGSRFGRLRDRGGDGALFRAVDVRQVGPLDQLARTGNMRVIFEHVVRARRTDD